MDKVNKGESMTKLLISSPYPKVGDIFEKGDFIAYRMDAARTNEVYAPYRVMIEKIEYGDIEYHTRIYVKRLFEVGDIVVFNAHGMLVYALAQRFTGYEEYKVIDTNGTILDDNNVPFHIVPSFYNYFESLMVSEY